SPHLPPKPVSLCILFSNQSTTYSPSIFKIYYFFTTSSEVTNFPEFVAIGMVDDIQIDYYDSNTKRYLLKQDWMKKVTDDDADYLEEETEKSVGSQLHHKNSTDQAEQFSPFIDEMIHRK
uniref:MHC class I-like antigen recognition-like domain-containing protein n=1 Tax=Labrus bergylta TaxID=56723 RepID=A0A3Q3NS33_9LABR